MTPEGPLYEHLDFCTDAETLYEKLRSGTWDWLGVKKGRDGKPHYVLGYPGRVRLGRPTMTVTRQGADVGQHGVRYYIPYESNPTDEWCSSADAAREAFEREMNDGLAKRGPGVARIVLIQHGEKVKEDWIVRSPLTTR